MSSQGRYFILATILVILIASFPLANRHALIPGLAMGNAPSLTRANPHLVWKLYQDDNSLARRGMAATYDSQRQVVVMFGGYNTLDSVLNETWEFDGTIWQKATPLHSPPGRGWHGLAYDDARHVVVLFGGENGSGALNDTWEYDGTDWVQVTPDHSPGWMVGFGITFDSCRQKVVLYGGGETPTATWEYDGADWQEITTSANPGSLFLSAMTFDSIRCRVVLFGGDAGAATGSDKTWEYDGADWTQVATTASPLPRWAQALTYDKARGKTILFGGYGPKYPEGESLSDTWEYDGTNWVETTPPDSPSPREQHVLVYAGVLEKTLLFGGFGNGETWLYGNEYSVSLPLILRQPE